MTDEDFYILGDKCSSCAIYCKCTTVHCRMCNNGSLFKYVIDEDDRPIGGFRFGSP